MLYLHGIGHFHPENEISNQFLTDLDIGTNDKWIVDRTGIHSRRTVLDLDYIIETKNADTRGATEACQYNNAQLAARAGQLAMERAGVGPEDIGLIIGGGSVPDYGTPAEAAMVANELGIECTAFDLRSACTSFGVALWFLKRMKEEELPPYVMIAMAETVTRSVDYSDRAAAVLWGDAGMAAVVSTRPGRAEILPQVLDSRPSGHDKVIVPWAGYFAQEGRTVQTYAIKTTSRLLNELRDMYGEEAGEQFYFIGHQANLRMLENVCKRSGLPREQHLHNCGQYGNTATAGSPSTMSQNWDRFKAGDHVAVVGVGAGLTWTSTMFRFQS